MQTRNATNQHHFLLIVAPLFAATMTATKPKLKWIDSLHGLKDRINKQDRCPPRRTGWFFAELTD